MFLKILSCMCGGLIVATLGYFVVTIAITGSNPETNNPTGLIVFFIFWLFSIVIAMKAKCTSKVWRRLLLTSAVISFMLPLASFIFSVNYIVETASIGNEYTDAAIAGAMIGSGIIVFITGSVGFFLGIIFLIIGLLVGRDNK